VAVKLFSACTLALGHMIPCPNVNQSRAIFGRRNCPPQWKEGRRKVRAMDVSDYCEAGREDFESVLAIPAVEMTSW
jgi:hypothetical protein